MTIDERLESIARSLDTLTKIHVDDDREYRERLESLEHNLESTQRNLDTLTNIHVDDDREYRQRFSRNEDRLAHLMDTMNRLGRILEIHEHRLDDLEGR